jgi:hypothetical protein
MAAAKLSLKPEKPPHDPVLVSNMINSLFRFLARFALFS